MTKLVFTRTQTVSLDLKRKPTKTEMKIILGQHPSKEISDLPEDLGVFCCDGEVLEEDYSDFLIDED